ncbi:MAG TPA: type II secretion system F family protein [Planctomycetota bacterium]|jgi:general secretion pathway protein F
MVDALDQSVTEALRAWRVQHGAGIPLAQSLQSCATVCESSTARNCFDEAARRSADGRDIESLLEALAPLLPEGERALIAAGWRSGRVEAALDGLVSHRDLWANVRRKIRARLVLPGLVLLLASLVAPLPGLLANNGTLGGYLFSALLPLGAAFVIWKMATGALAWRTAGMDQFLLSLPVVGPFERVRARSQVATLLGQLLGAGLGVQVSLEICARAVRSETYRQDVLRCAEIVGRGRPLSDALKPGPLWPAEFAGAVAIGEKSGSLDETLARIGRAETERMERAAEAMADWIPRLIYALIALYVIWQIAMLVMNVAGLYQQLGI